MRSKLLSKTSNRKGLMIRCLIALIVFSCSIGNLMAQTDKKMTINVDNTLIRAALEQLQKSTQILGVYYVLRGSSS